MASSSNRDAANSAKKYSIEPIRPYLKNITIYETRARWYIVASDGPKQKYRVLKLLEACYDRISDQNAIIKYPNHSILHEFDLCNDRMVTRLFVSCVQIDRTLQSDLSVVEDPVVYSFGEVQDLLTMIGDANGQYGGIKKSGEACALIGFVRFLRGYYMIFATKRKCVGMIGKHKIYSIEATQDYYIPNAAYARRDPVSQTSGSAASTTANIDADEERYRNLFSRFNLTKDFYFSYTYDLTNNLQYNMTRKQSESNVFPPYNDMFVWNHYLLEPLLNLAKSDHNMWLCPIIHGSFVQHKADVYGKIIQLTLIARRSRLFAGARFLKRGINEQGYCANDVETEQIVCEPNMGAQSDSHLTSFVQHRGSIPLYWAQLNAGVMPKPPIIIQRVDPFHNATILHFMDLFRRYGSPIIVLNLVRSKEKSPREMILREAFGQAIEFINSSIDEEKNKIIYMAWDFKKAAKNNRSKLQRDMMAIAQLSASRIGFFHSGRQLERNRTSDSGQTLENLGRPTAGGLPYPQSDRTGRLQTGVVRTNCIDSIDRTNAAQYLLALCVLGHQLYEMGILSSPSLSSDSGISLLLMDMYEMVGHQLALQYGGSGLAHTMNTFNSKSIVDTSKDFWTTIQRYYSNTFTDQEKQSSINLFLGVFKPWQSDTRLWSLETDYFLHMTDYCKELLYIHRWWEEPLKKFYGALHHRYLSNSLVPLEQPSARPDISFTDHYATSKLSEFDKMLAAHHQILKKVAVCKRPKKVGAASSGHPASAPPSPTPSHHGAGTPPISSGLGGIMRWLWSPRSDSKVFDDQVGRRSSEAVAPDYSASNINPLARYGTEVKTNKSDLILFDKYTDLSKLAHRQRKRRKRYGYYRQYYQRTHHRLPSIYTAETKAESTSVDIYTKYVECYRNAKYEPVDSPRQWSLKDPKEGQPTAGALQPSESFANYQHLFDISPPPSFTK